jgi:hypothetical protein
MEVANTLAFYYIITITAVKWFIVQAPLSNLARKKIQFLLPIFQKPFRQDITLFSIKLERLLRSDTNTIL